MRMAEEYPGGTREEKLAVISEHKKRLEGSANIPEALKPLIIQEFESHGWFLELEYRRPSPDPLGRRTTQFQTGQIGWKFWAVRNDSLKFVEILSATAMAITTFVVVVGSSPAVLAVGLIFAAVTLADRLKRKGASLNDEQYKILIAMKAAGPSTLMTLAELLSGLHIYGQNVWTEDRTLAALNLLKSVHLGDGTTEALVTQAADGRWATNGI
jgi:hypothetical protein